MRRRQFLRAGGLAAAVGVAGCVGSFGAETRAVNQPPLADFRPNAVYVPTHVEGMQMVGMQTAGRRAVGLFYSYPHRFWTVTGTRTEQVELTRDDTVHLMSSVWDTETGTVIPVDTGLSWEILQDGELVTERTPWPMLSQNMGFHFGDNVALPGDGTYTVRGRIGGTSVRRTGGFEGEFDERVTVEFEFEYAESERNDIPFQRLEDDQGSEGATSPMEMEMLPLSVAPDRADLPGTVVGEARSGDAVFLVSRTDSRVVISPRTPYNQYVLPMMSLSATVDRGGETVFDEPLVKALDPALGYHYLADATLEAGDKLTLTVDAPPQVSRHEGYEMAFLEMEPMTFDVA